MLKITPAARARSTTRSLRRPKTPAEIFMNAPVRMASTSPMRASGTMRKASQTL